MKKIYGDRLPPGSVGSRQVPAMPASKMASPPIQLARWFRNGKHPNAQALNLMNEAANQAALFRSKEVFRGCGRIGVPDIISSTAGSRARWRFAFHSGPFAHALMVIVNLAPPNSNQGNDTYGKLTLYTDTQEAVVAGSAEFHYGAGLGTTFSARGWSYLKPIIQFIDVQADTDYFGKFTDETYGRIQSAVVFELPSLTKNFAGYLAQNNSVMTPVLDVYREKLALLTRSMWRRGAAHIINFTVDDGTAPATIASATDTNWVDGSTVISAASAGPTLVMTNKDRLSETSGVPVKLWAFGKMSAASVGGNIKVKSSAGATIGSIANGWNGTTPTWVSTTFNMPAGVDKYDFQFSTPGGSGTFSCYALSMLEHHT